jgi:hypothetical protein
MEKSDLKSGKNAPKTAKNAPKTAKNALKTAKIWAKVRGKSNISHYIARKKDRFSLKNRPFKLNTSDILLEIPLNYTLKFLLIIDKSMRIA